MKTADLTGADLDYWVAKAEGYELDADGDNRTIRENGGAPSAWHPSTDWRQGGPIIEREKITLIRQTIDWCADMRGVECQFADNPLVAAMRAFVCSVFGPEVNDDAPTK